MISFRSTYDITRLQYTCLATFRSVTSASIVSFVSMTLVGSMTLPGTMILVSIIRFLGTVV